MNDQDLYRVYGKDADKKRKQSELIRQMEHIEESANTWAETPIDDRILYFYTWYKVDMLDEEWESAFYQLEYACSLIKRKIRKLYCA